MVVKISIQGQTLDFDKINPCGDRTEAVQWKESKEKS